MSLVDYAKQCGLSYATAKRYRKAGINFEDPASVLAYKEAQRSRFAVSKSSPRVATIEVLAPPSPIVAAPTEGDSTIARLEAAERIAYQRYLDSGASERAGQMWLLCCDQLRKARADAAKLGNDVTESDRKLIQDCVAVFYELVGHLDALPKLAGCVGEGLGRFEIETRVKLQLEQIWTHALAGLCEVIAGTPFAAPLGLIKSEAQTLPPNEEIL